MIPAFTSDGLLPPGLHQAAWIELQQRFGITSYRLTLLRLMRLALINLKQANCATVYVDGSFVCAKTVPRDYDALWAPGGVDVALLDPVFLDFTNGRRAMKAKYGGDFFPSSSVEGRSGQLFLDFFQTDRVSGSRKGIVVVAYSGERDRCFRLKVTADSGGR